jgi:NifB/MoaA-like Fe-S oxidoreductase
MDNFDRLELPKGLKNPLKLTFAASYAGLPAIEYVVKKLNKIKNLSCDIKPVRSDYWGDGITVAGLITSDDLIRTVKNITADYVVIPGIMLKPLSELFLDGKDLNYVKKETNKDFIIIKNQYSLEELTEYLTGK